MPYLTGNTIPVTSRCKVIRIPDDLAFLDALNGALLELTYAYNFEADGAITPEQMADAFAIAYDDYTTEACMEIPIGSTMMWWTATPPAKWLICDNTAYSAVDYPELFAVLGFSFGGGGSVFNLPNMRSLSPMGVGGFINLGQIKGGVNQSISQANLPALSFPVSDPGHFHTLTDPGHVHTLTDPGHAHLQDIGGVDAYLGTGGTGRSAYGAVTTNSLTRVQTDNQTTGATVASHTTGVSVNSAGAGIAVASGGSGDSFEIVHPVRGAHFIIYAGR